MAQSCANSDIEQLTIGTVFDGPYISSVVAAAASGTVTFKKGTLWMESQLADYDFSAKKFRISIAFAGQRS